MGSKAEQFLSHVERDLLSLLSTIVFRCDHECSLFSSYDALFGFCLHESHKGMIHSSDYIITCVVGVCIKISVSQIWPDGNE